MAGIAWQDSPYEGRTSAPPWQRPYDSLDCRGCGSSLAGRREAVEKITTRGVCFVREVFAAVAAVGAGLSARRPPLADSTFRKL